jgi:hypothetical protein
MMMWCVVGLFGVRPLQLSGPSKPQLHSPTGTTLTRMCMSGPRINASPLVALGRWDSERGRSDICHLDVLCWVEDVVSRAPVAFVHRCTGTAAMLHPLHARCSE